MTNEEAYRILTRELTNMHHTERTALDYSDRYQEALDAVKTGQNGKAVSLVYGLRTGAGEASRTARGLPFTANAE